MWSRRACLSLWFLPTEGALDRLPQVSGALSADGACFMVAITQNDVPELKATAAAHGLTCEVVLIRPADEEKLHILKFKRAHDS